ncbi:hypothetical protein [Plantactinospora sp. KLBMP9567]|nr:hypothetical protein [Plantactinospora sp. KLBMP9567]MDW5327481.1 hypothetical protein [Plantactinospora sp. KLBMP9567]
MADYQQGVVVHQWTVVFQTVSEFFSAVGAVITLIIILKEGGNSIDD